MREGKSASHRVKSKDSFSKAITPLDVDLLFHRSGAFGDPSFELARPLSLSLDNQVFLARCVGSLAPSTDGSFARCTGLG